MTLPVCLRLLTWECYGWIRAEGEPECLRMHTLSVAVGSTRGSADETSIMLSDVHFGDLDLGYVCSIRKPSRLSG